MVMPVTVDVTPCTTHGFVAVRSLELVCPFAVAYSAPVPVLLIWNDCRNVPLKSDSPRDVATAAVDAHVTWSVTSCVTDGWLAKAAVARHSTSKPSPLGRQLKLTVGSSIATPYGAQETLRVPGWRLSTSTAREPVAVLINVLY